MASKNKFQGTLPLALRGKIVLENNCIRNGESNDTYKKGF
jgi:hypothetical protein